jgi:hypothetical protein
MAPAPTPDAMGLDSERGIRMAQTARSQQMLCRLAMIDEDLAEDQAGLALGLAKGSSLDMKTAELLR